MNKELIKKLKHQKEKALKSGNIGLAESIDKKLKNLIVLK